MYKRVDEIEIEFEGFSYLDEEGDEETVTLDGTCVLIENSAGAETCIFKSDIPKLIKALQEAYDYKECV